MLPFCVDTSTDEFLHELALRVHRDEALVESPTKRDVVRELLTGALSKMDMLPPSSPRYFSGHPILPPCKEFLLSCLETNCGEVGQAAVNKLADEIRSLSRADDPTFRSLFSMITELGDDIEEMSLSSTPTFITELSTTTCDLFLDALVSREHRLRVLNLRSFCKSSGGIAAFLSR